MKPLPRSGMSIAMAPNGKVYTFGGVLDTKEDEEDLEGQFGNDLHVFDINGQVWRHIELKKSKSKKTETDEVAMEEGTSGSTTTTNELGFTVTVGGPSKSSVSNSPKKLPEGHNIGFPSPRMNTGMVICNKMLFLYGGLFEQGHRQYTLSDFYSLDVNKFDSWRTLIANSNTQEWLGSDSEGESDSDEESDSGESGVSDGDEDDDEEGDEDTSGMETE